MKRIFFAVILTVSAVSTQAQSNSTYWQQHVDYTMDIDMDVDTYQYEGKQKLRYTNNSPDVLDQVFYHLYFNAFQPNSEMYAHSQNIPDPDRRFIQNVSNLVNLRPDQIGFIEVESLKQDGKKVQYEVIGMAT